MSVCLTNAVPSVKPECEQCYQMEIKTDTAVFMRVTKRGKAHKLVHVVLAVVFFRYLRFTSPDRKDPTCFSV